MKNKQPIFQSFLLIFFVFGMVQTTFGQTIDSMSKVILDKVEERYAVFETMQYTAQMEYEVDMEDNEDDVEIIFSTDNIHLRVDVPYRVTITNGKKTQDYLELLKKTETRDFDKNMNVLWFSNIVDFCRKSMNVTFVKTTKYKNQTVDIISITSIENDDDFGKMNIYVSQSTNEILKYLIEINDEKENVEMIFTNFKANPTFPDDYFEIKE